MSEGQEVTKQVSAPLEAEQQAAEKGIVTETQKRANEVMGKNIAKAAQTVLDKRLVVDRGVHLQRGFEAVQRKAKEARYAGSIPAARDTGSKQ